MYVYICECMYKCEMYLCTLFYANMFLIEYGEEVVVMNKFYFTGLKGKLWRK